MSSNLEQYIPLLESYLCSNNKEDFVSKINDTNQRDLLNCITDDSISIEDLKNKMKFLVLPPSIQSQIITSKIRRYINKSTSLGDDSLAKEIKSKYSQVNF